MERIKLQEPLWLLSGVLAKAISEDFTISNFAHINKLKFSLMGVGLLLRGVAINSNHRNARTVASALRIQVGDS